MDEMTTITEPAGADTPPAAPPETPPSDPPAQQPETQAKPPENPFGFPQEPVVPEVYEFNLPEGLTVSDEQKEAFSAVAKEAKMTQEQANSLLKMHADIVMEQQRQAEEIKNQWMNECAKQGLNTPENLAAAKIAVDTFGGDDAMNALIESGAAYHPAVQAFLQRIGHLLQEDNAPDGKAVTQTSAADLLFANSKY
ncbi:hypothetical protein [Selenomonas noxia]|jgi:hypothetical protein|uniref:hypothetical protein n=1 Tax=Selenomonas noxia TaxID=135083 RepID=UPI002058B6F3|nr:hypothetical protein [Selenomonas noxia]DAS96828.1 MAG TPA: putative protease [Caudoviricetes sp.]